MAIQININGSMQEVTQEQLFGLARQNVITPDTVVIVNGKPYLAKKAKGIVFGNPQTTDTVKQISEQTNVSSQRESVKTRSEEKYAIPRQTVVYFASGVAVGIVIIGLFLFLMMSGQNNTKAELQKIKAHATELERQAREAEQARIAREVELDRREVERQRKEREAEQERKAQQAEQDRREVERQRKEREAEQERKAQQAELERERKELDAELEKIAREAEQEQDERKREAEQILKNLDEEERQEAEQKRNARNNEARAAAILRERAVNLNKRFTADGVIQLLGMPTTREARMGEGPTFHYDVGDLSVTIDFARIGTVKDVTIRDHPQPEPEHYQAAEILREKAARINRNFTADNVLQLLGMPNTRVVRLDGGATFDYRAVGVDVHIVFTSGYRNGIVSDVKITDRR